MRNSEQSATLRSRSVGNPKSRRDGPISAQGGANVSHSEHSRNPGLCEERSAGRVNRSPCNRRSVEADAGHGLVRPRQIAVLSQRIYLGRWTMPSVTQGCATFVSLTWLHPGLRYGHPFGVFGLQPNLNLKILNKSEIRSV